jgi:hypothetical protein
MRHQWCDETPASIATHQPGSSDTSLDRHAPQGIATHQVEPETKSQREVQNSKIIKTYSDFIKTLSEGERENFLNFVREQIQNLPKPVNDVEAWLASQNASGQNRWEVYYNNFVAARQKNQQGSSAPRSQRDIQALAAECRRRHKEEIEQQRIAAERAFAKREAQREAQSVLSPQNSEKLAELLSCDPERRESEKRRPEKNLRPLRREIEQLVNKVKDEFSLREQTNDDR